MDKDNLTSIPITDVSLAHNIQFVNYLNWQTCMHIFFHTSKFCLRTLHTYNHGTTKNRYYSQTNFNTSTLHSRRPLFTISILHSWRKQIIKKILSYLSPEENLFEKCKICSYIFNVEFRFHVEYFLPKRVFLAYIFSKNSR